MCVCVSLLKVAVWGASEIASKPQNEINICIEVMLAAQVKINIPDFVNREDSFGCTPIHVAARRQSVDAAMALIDVSHRQRIKLETHIPPNLRGGVADKFLIALDDRMRTAKAVMPPTFAVTVPPERRWISRFHSTPLRARHKKT